jgi:hypothetical protein
MQKIAVTLPEATELSGIGRSSLYKLFNEGKLKPRKSGKRTLVLVSELEALPQWSSQPEGHPMKHEKETPEALAGAVRGDVVKTIAAVSDNAKGYRRWLVLSSGLCLEALSPVALHGAAGLPARPDWREDDMKRFPQITSCHRQKRARSVPIPYAVSNREESENYRDNCRKAQCRLARHRMP